MSIDPSAQNHHALNVSAARASVAAALLLIGLKLWALWMTGALSIAASLADSALDMLMSLGAMFAISYAARPPDDDHAFGHSSVEDLAAFLQALVLTLAALGLILSGSQRMLAEQHPKLESEGIGIIAMLVSTLVTGMLVLWQTHVAKRTGNPVIAADRLHYIADLLPNLGAIAALVASKYLEFWQLDSIVALLAALVLLRGAWQIGRNAWNSLMDARADPQIVAGIAEIAGNWPGVKGWHDLKTRTAGSRIFVHLHIELDGNQSLREAHGIGAGLRQAILSAYPHADVIIHKDVWHET